MNLMQTFTCKTRVFWIRVQVRMFKWKIFGKPCLKMFDAYCVGYWSIPTLMKHGNRMQPEFRFGAEDCVGAATVHNIGFFQKTRLFCFVLAWHISSPIFTQKRFWRFYATIWSMKLSHTLGKPSLLISVVLGAPRCSCRPSDIKFDLQLYRTLKPCEDAVFGDFTRDKPQPILAVRPNATPRRPSVTGKRAQLNRGEMGVSENRLVPLKPMVNDHYPY